MAESFRPQYVALQPTLALLAEPVSRPALMHEYRMTPFSLGVAVSNGLTAELAVVFLENHCYELTGSELHSTIKHFIESCMGRYNMARIVVDGDRTLLICKDQSIASSLRDDTIIHSLAAQPVELRHDTFRWNGEFIRCTYLLLQSRAVCKAVAARCVFLALPIQQQYDYESDTSIRTAHMHLRSQTKPRPYQVEAVEAATSDCILTSGCLLLPCGAGKTLLGIMLMCKVRKPTLVICAGSVSVEQWRNQILEYAVLDPPHDSRHSTDGKPVCAGAARIACLTGKQKDDIDENTDVVLTTYSMLVSAHRTQMRMLAKSRGHAASTRQHADLHSEGKKRHANPRDKLFRPYGLLLLDEVHVMPAEAFRESLSLLDAKGVVGLTATYVREDKRIYDLFHLVGPKLYDVSMEQLVAQGYLAKVNCLEVHTPMTVQFGMEYMERSSVASAATAEGYRVPALVMLAAANPNKMLCLRELVHRHLQSGAKILVFCDHIMLLYEYGRILNAPVISGKTLHKDRLMMFSDFQSTSKVNVLCVSRVGDVSVNLPSASVVIQVSSHGGSRRQEAQRLGRILRPKDRAANGKDVEAWFYSIISENTLEVVYGAHRTAFLIDQGYTCRIIEYDPQTAPTVEEDGFTFEASASRDVKKQVKADTLVGDIVSIKQEALQAPWSPTVGQQSPLCNEDITSLPYQLRLLSKVVCTWELEFQRHNRKRIREDPASPVAEVDTTDEVEVVELDRTYSDIKREYARQHTGGAAASTSLPAQNLADLVGVNDGMVYHEL